HTHPAPVSMQANRAHQPVVLLLMPRTRRMSSLPRPARTAPLQRARRPAVVKNTENTENTARKPKHSYAHAPGIPWRPKE
ncbi:hypothetical protein LR392_21135, partial [Arthrobacter sp. AK04]|uniref:hypothetical protein n=1 Tax=Arthrobacter sp. AK04 TaxID=2900048 RepID=UPI001E502221